MEKVANFTSSLQVLEHAGMAAVGKMLAAMIHYEAVYVVYQVSPQRTSVLDSGAARHVHPDVVITDMENRTQCHLSSFTGEGAWADGIGCIPCEFTDDLTPKQFKLDISYAYYVNLKGLGLGIDCALLLFGLLGCLTGPCYMHPAAGLPCRSRKWWWESEMRKVLPPETTLLGSRNRQQREKAALVNA